MRSKEILLLMLALVATHLTEDKVEGDLMDYAGRESRVQEVTLESYESFIEEENTLVFFYIPTDRLSAQIGKILDETSMQLEEEHTAVKIGRVNVKTHIKAKDLDWMAPKMFFHRGGEKTLVKGTYYKMRQMANELQILSGQYPRPVSYAELMHYHQILGFFYLYIGEAPPHVLDVFAHPHHSEKMLVTMHVYHGLPTGTLLAIRDFQQEDSEVLCAQCTDSDAVRLFVQQTWAPDMATLDKGMVDYLFGKQGKAMILFYDEQKDFLAANALRSSSHQVRQQGLLVLTSDLSGIGRKLAVFLELTPTTPQLVIVDNDGQYANDIKKYVMKKSMKMEHVLEFAGLFSQGLLKQDLLSQEIGAAEENNVRVLVGKNLLHELFVQPERANLLLVHSENSGLCKVLMPEYEKVASRLKGFPGIQVAKIDGHHNRLDGIKFAGFPSVKFIPAQSTDAVDFDEDYHVDGFMKFLGDNVEGLSAFLAGEKQEL